MATSKKVNNGSTSDVIGVAIMFAAILAILAWTHHLSMKNSGCTDCPTGHYSFRGIYLPNYVVVPGNVPSM
jgi:hypothetical protein